jgi:hypothetical protein
VPLALEDPIEVLKEAIGALEGEWDLRNQDGINHAWM